MKKILCGILAAAMLLSSVPCAFAEGNVYRDIYVDVNGSDSAAGDKASPFATLLRAQEEVRKINADMTGDIVVHLGEGTFRLEDRMLFTTEDSGKNGYNVIWQGAEGDKTAVSGGEQIGGFKASEEYEGVWETTVPQADTILQMSVNGEMRYVAKSANMVKGLPRNENVYNDEYYKQHPEDKMKEFTYYYVDPNTQYLADGFYMSKRDIGFYENQEDILFMANLHWISRIMPLQSIEQNPNDAEQVIVRMKNPLFSSEINLNDFIECRFNPKREFTIMNAMELLDEPGEFYFNRKTKKLYYIPEENENMNTAEVVVPKLENLITILGNDIDDKVTNLVFNGITFRDTKFDYMNGVFGNQAVTYYTPRTYGKGFNGVEVSYADNINFSDNVFKCMAGVALRLLNACRNCNVSGNVFYDIGDSAIIFGAPYHGDYNLGASGVSEDVPVSEKNAPVELLQRIDTRVDSSSYRHTNKENSLFYVTYQGLGYSDATYQNGDYDFLNKTWFNEESLTENHNKKPYDGAWKDDASYLENKKPWVKFELDRSYKLDEIIVSFDPNVLKPEETSGFEILASNDIDFKEYDVIRTVDTPEKDINRYKVDKETKYRYIMIRSLTPKVFGLSHVWATTKDIKPYVKNQRLKNITIENNYCERIGTIFARSIGLIVLHGEKFKISHNEFRDVGYSGMSIGYSWNRYLITCRNFEVDYNLTYDTTQAMHDGGGIYTLGPQPGSVYRNNYIQFTRLGLNSFYTDNGSRYMNINGNIMMGGTYLLSPYAKGETGISENIFRNNYGNHDVAQKTAMADNDWEELIMILPGQAIDSVSYDTIAHAGLEKEYKNLSEKVPRAHNNLEFKYELSYSANTQERAAIFSSEKTGIESELPNISTKAVYGNGLGMYPYECKNMIDDTKEYYEGASNTDIYMRVLKVHELEENLMNMFRRYSFEDTLKLCEEQLSFARDNTVPEPGQKSCNKYPKEAVDEFAKVIEETKNKSANMTIDEEYKYLTRLENAYNTLESKKNSAEIEYVYADGVSKIDINKDERTVKLYLPKNASTKLTGVDIRVSQNAKLAKIVGTEVDLEKPITLPIHCNGNNRYEMWTMSIVREEAEDISNLGNAEWVTTSEEAKEMIKKYQDHGTHLPASEYIYMANGFAKNGTTGFSFKPVTQNEINTFSVILGADTLENQENSTTVNNRCEVVFNDNKADFYKIVNGQKTLVKSIPDVNINYNQKNDFAYTVTEAGDNLYFKVWLNGKLIFTPVINSYSWDGYTGIYSRYMDIKIYK